MKKVKLRKARSTVGLMMRSTFVKNNPEFYGCREYRVGGDNYFLFCDGVRFLCLDNDFGFPHIRPVFAVQVFLECSFRAPCEINIKELREVVVASGRTRVLYWVGDTCFNARLLLQMLETLQINSICLGEKPVDGAFFENDKGEFGMLMPVEVSDESFHSAGERYGKENKKTCITS